MILVDVNLLVYAFVAMPQHEAAREWLDEKLNSRQRVGMPWVSLAGFLRVATNRRIFERAADVSQAWGQVEAWLSCSNVWIPEPGPEHRQILGRLLQNLGGGHALIPDAHLAALAIENGLTLCSSDGDFARFSGLRWRNPIAR